MKYTLLLVATLFFSFTLVTDDPIDWIGVKGPVEFNKISFELVWSGKPKPNYFVQKYLFEGEKLESFNQMLTFSVFTTDIKPGDAVKQKVKELENRKKTDTLCNYNVTESPDHKESMIAFLQAETKNNKMALVEFNASRYQQIKINSKKKVLYVFSYSVRSYGDSIAPFLKTLKDKRVEYLNLMMAAYLPEINLGRK